MNDKPKRLKKLQEKRIEMNYSYLDMAKMLLISKTYYWQIENGYRRLNYNLAKQIANILQTKPDDIFYDDL
jgi:putative transcriptional regulator